MIPPCLNPSDVALVILNYHNAVDTIACLQSVYAMPDKPSRVIVVDNNSQDGSLTHIIKAWKRLSGPVRLVEEGGEASTAALCVRLSENGGYAAGNNAGIRLALQDPDCQALWILNNDTLPVKSALSALCIALNAEPKAGIVGSTLLFDGKERIIQCLGGASINVLYGSTKSIMEFTPLKDITNLDPKIVNTQIDFVTGASMLVRREVFEKVGLLPEEYFLYYEDVDFGIRVKRSGYGLIWAPSSIVIHKDGRSSQEGDRGRVPKWIDYLILRNRIYFVRKYFFSSLPIALVGYIGVAINRIRRRQTDRLGIIFYAIIDGLFGIMELSEKVKKLRSVCR